jgi:hypothetical protein
MTVSFVASGAIEEFSLKSSLIIMWSGGKDENLPSGDDDEEEGELQ